MDRKVVARGLIYMSSMAVVYVLLKHGSFVDQHLEASEVSDATVAATAGTGADFLSKPADQMTEADIVRYIHFTNSTSCRITQDFGGKMIKANQIVALDGQRPVCFDLGVTPKRSSCMVYTTNGGEKEFHQAFAKYGCNVFIFGRDKDSDEEPNLHLRTTGIGPNNSEEGGQTVRTLSSVHNALSKQPGHPEIIDFVQLDIEGKEWETIVEVINSGILDKIKQFTVELHFNDASLPIMRQRVGILKSLEASGMVRFASRPNLFWPLTLFSIRDYYIYEMSWYNQKFFFE